MDQFSLRPVTTSDYDALAKLWLASWQSTGLAVAALANAEELRGRIPAELANGWDVTVGVVGPRLVGFLAIKPADAWLDQLFVAPDFQGKGFGRRLLAHAKETMPNGFSLFAAVDYAKADAFYLRSGLVKTKTAMHPEFGHAIAFYQWN
ncbi:MAG: GNAT family N-acetyltransferase [Rhodospirillales bacterium]|nr:GNAT family N-acetyltransferase [Rhodospirillales bacterium]